MRNKFKQIGENKEYLDKDESYIFFLLMLGLSQNKDLTVTSEDIKEDR